MTRLKGLIMNKSVNVAMLAGLCLTFIRPAAASSSSPPAAAGANPEVKMPARLIQSSRPLIIAHRGYSRLAPENTLPAFRRGLEAGADLIELDYHHTKDGIPVALHDYTLDRTTDATHRWGGKGLAVDKYTRAQLAELDAGNWFSPRFAGTRLPTLKESVDLIQPHSITLIERKAGDAVTLMKLLQEWDLMNQVVVQSFDWKFVRECRSLNSEVILGALGPPSTLQGRKLTEPEKVLNQDFIRAIQEMGANLVVWNSQITPESVSLAQQAGLRVWVYTIDDPVKAKALVLQGVNGIITNDPETIQKAISSQTQAGQNQPPGN